MGKMLLSTSSYKLAKVFPGDRAIHSTAQSNASPLHNSRSPISKRQRDLAKVQALSLHELITQQGGVVDWLMSVTLPPPSPSLPFIGSLTTAFQPACFDAACQGAKDNLLVASLAVPLLVFAAALAYLLRPPPKEGLDDGTLFEDKATGILFQATEGTSPERDGRGELAFRVESYTPWPVEEGAVGERLRINVGVVGERQPCTFVFTKALAQPSQLIVTTLERPLGIVFEEDAQRKRVVVGGFVPGGRAEQRAKNARLNTSLAASEAMHGDVLRACTCTTVIFGGRSLPQRCIVLYGADNQRWPQVVAALKKGLVADGPVTLVLERRLQAGSRKGSPDAAASPL